MKSRVFIVVGHGEGTMQWRGEEEKRAAELRIVGEHMFGR